MKKCSILLAATIIALLGSSLVFAHDTFNYIGPGWISVTTFHSHQDPVDVECGTTYRLKTKDAFHQVTTTQVNFHQTDITPTIYYGSVLGGTYRFGTYSNPNVYINYDKFGETLVNEATFTFHPHRWISYSGTNEVVVEFNSYAADSGICRNIDFNHYYPN